MSAVLTIAVREFTERARSKGFVIGNVVVLVLIGIGALLPRFLPDGEPARIAVSDDASRALVALAAADPGDVVEALPVDDRDAAEQAVRDGEADAALIDGGTLLVGEGASDGALRALQSAARFDAIDGALARRGVAEAERQGLLTGEVLTVRELAEPDEGDAFRDGASMLAFFGVMALYGLLIIYGQWVAQGIVEEKQSRVIEVLLSAVSPAQLLTGKVLGIGLLGFVQVLFLAGVGMGALLYAAPIDLPPDAWSTVAVVVAWYVVGFAVYAVLFAGVGAICARVEELQAASMPIMFLIFAGIFCMQVTMTDPGGTVARVAGLVPFTAPLIQPVRVSVGNGGLGETALAVALAVLTVAALVPLAARLYSGGVLKTRSRVSLREAWRSGAGA